MFIQAAAKLSHSIAANRKTGRMRMAAKLVQQIATCRQTTEEMIRLNAARRTVAHLTIQ